VVAADTRDLLRQKAAAANSRKRPANLCRQAGSAQLIAFEELVRTAHSAHRLPKISIRK